MNKLVRTLVFFVIIANSIIRVAYVEASAGVKIAIFYPNSAEPYRSIYQDIINGSRHFAQLQGAANVELVAIALTPNFDLKMLVKNLRQQKIDRVILLGRLGYRLASQLPTDFSVVTGAIPNGPNEISGISLISAPQFLFQSLKNVAPRVKRIHIAYSKSSDWLIDLALVAAQKQGLSLRLKKVKTTGQAIAFYQQLFQSGLTSQDAIWLPVDRIASNDKIILPLILEQAWTQDIVVFSSKPSHAKRGALFSTYPDNYRLGEMLVQLLDVVSADKDSTHFSALSSVQLAVNLRTAAHLGFQYNREQKQQFKLLFPE